MGLVLHVVSSKIARKEFELGVCSLAFKWIGWIFGPEHVNDLGPVSY